MLRTVWPESWFRVKTCLEEMNAHYISYRRYSDICREQDIGDARGRDTLVEFLHDLGVILNFKDFELQDTHVLEPKWVTEAVYKIINSPVLAKGKGVLKLKRLEDILAPKTAGDYHYPRDKHPYIIGLMEKFELCYKLDRNTVLIPDLLKVRESEFDFDYPASLKFVFEYDFLPRSVMPRFIVRRNKVIKGDLQWRTGVVLADTMFNTAAVIKADNEERRISIFVSGEQKRGHLSAIRRELRDIHDSFEKLEVAELVPLPDYPEISVEYEELAGYELSGRDEIFIGKLRKAYSVRQLLDGIETKEERYMGKDKKGDTHYHFYGGQKVVSTGDKAKIDYQETVIDEKIALLIRELNKHNVEGKEAFIQQLQDESVRKDPQRWPATIGKIITAAGGIASIISAATALLG